MKQRTTPLACFNVIHIMADTSLEDYDSFLPSEDGRAPPNPIC